MRRIAWLSFLFLLAPGVASAVQPKCQMTLDSCVVAFGRMHERPWLGVRLHLDSLSKKDVIDSVIVGGPAWKAGIRPGDVLETIDNRPALEYFISTRAGWKDGDRMQAAVTRKGREVAVPFIAERMPEDRFARIVGEHMLQAHLAYMDVGDDHDHEKH